MMKQYKHINGNDRVAIQLGLERGDFFKTIAEAIGKHPSSVANEVRKYREFKKCGAQGNVFNDCAHRFDCRKTNLCDSPQCRRKNCRFCARCRDHCGEYELERCAKLAKPPYVCYGCRQKQHCTLEKAFYDAGIANQTSLNVLSESRMGINADEEDMECWTKTIVPLIKRGQSLYHILHTTSDTANLPSQRTLYSYVEKGGLSGVCSLDLPRQVKYKKRYVKRTKTDTAYRKGRSHEEFLKYMEENPDTPLVEIDSVVDAGGKHAILTMHFVEISMMLAYLRNGKDSQSVVNIFDTLTESLGLEKFRELFPVILTDNGSEFSNPEMLEKTSSGESRTKIFFCEPYSSYKKGAIENNHELIRRILPKGVSFEGLAQKDITDMMNNINSYARKKLNGHTPYDMFSFLHGAESAGLLRELGLKAVKAKNMLLTPSLISRKQPK